MRDLAMSVEEVVVVTMLVIYLPIIRCHSGAREARARNPYSRWWLWIPGLRAAHTSRNDGGVWVGSRSHPKQLRIARLDLFALGFHAGGVLLHQLDGGELAPSR